VRTSPRYSVGNRVTLLQNGEDFFPALEDAIANAQELVWLETYIFADDPTGRRIRDALTAAALRGIQIRLVVDGFGSGALPAGWWDRFEQAGGELRVFRRERGWWPITRSRLSRLHRKLAVVDGRLAFVGGINIEDDWDIPGQSAPRFDFAVKVEGPLVDRVMMAMEKLWWRLHWRHPASLMASLKMSADYDDSPQTENAGQAALMLRDNWRHRFDIERAYLEAIAEARDEILIANAYFLPGQRFRHALIQAARKGVRVRLMLQGMVEYRLQHAATRALYGALLDAGVEIYEYLPSHLHAKVALADGSWATVGSSNIDPFSLLLAREANVIIEEPAFASELKNRLELALADHSWKIEASAWHEQPLLTRLRCWLAYGLVRWGMGLAGLRDH
jgi:cardiolipin synthase A/B